MQEKKENRFSYIKLILIMLSVTLGACASPPTSELYYNTYSDEAEIATIHDFSMYRKDWGVGMAFIIPFPKKLEHLSWIERFDGLDTNHHGYFSRKMYVKAGQHSMKLSYKRQRLVHACGYLWCNGPYFTKDGIDISFLAEAEHQYRVFAYIPDEQEWVWIEDIATGKVVAGERPKDLDIN